MLVPPATVKGTTGTENGRAKSKKNKSKEVLAAFKEKCGQLGVVWHEDRAKDIAALLAALKANWEGLDE